VASTWPPRASAPGTDAMRAAPPQRATFRGGPRHKERPIAPPTPELRINDRIRVEQVRLVDQDGQQLGIRSTREALELAQDQDLDLVEIAPTANPPVCRIMDYGKFKFDEAQKVKESRRKSQGTGIKEMKYRPKIGPGDFDTKTRLVAKFLEEGHKVKITIMFRGREVFHPELGKRILDRVEETIGDGAKVEAEARLDGRNMTMVLAPDKRVRQQKAKESEAVDLNGLSPSSNGSAAEVAEAVVPSEES
jgi:translation initiation factor IF-3